MGYPLCYFLPMCANGLRIAVIAEDGRLVRDDAPGALFPWWSIGKTVLAAAALRLVERGCLALDAPLPGRSFTLRELLQHRAGVPNYGGLAAYHAAVARRDDPWPVGELLERVDAERLDFPPGRGWSYSNVGYLYLRQLVEEAQGAGLEAALRALVLDPLELASVSLAAEPGDLEATAWGNAAGYHPGWVYHGLLLGSAADAARLLSGLLAGQLLPPPLLDAMTAAHPLGGPLAGRPWETTGYGLGLMIGRMAGAGLAIGHSGCGPGSVSAAYHFREGRPPRTAAAFAPDSDGGGDEGVTEWAVARVSCPSGSSA